MTQQWLEQYWNSEGAAWINWIFTHIQMYTAFCAPAPTCYGGELWELKAIKWHIWPITQHAMVSKLNLLVSGPGSTFAKECKLLNWPTCLLVRSELLNLQLADVVRHCSLFFWVFKRWLRFNTFQCSCTVLAQNSN